MMVLIAASSLFTVALQASIAGPTDAFRACLKQAAATATSEKVAPDGIEDYFKAQCSGQMEALKSAVIAFRVKNGMARKTATADAEMTVEDYLAAPVDRYRFVAEMNASAAPKNAAAPAQATPAAAPSPPQEPRP